MATQASAGRVLVVDDDAATCDALGRALKLEGYDVITSCSAKQALEVVGSASIQLVITDVVMPEMSGIALLEKVHEHNPDMPVVVCSGYGTIESAVDAMRKGAVDYLTKPINLDSLMVKVDHALLTSAIKAENRALKRQLIERHSYHDAIGRSPRMQAVFERVEAIAPTDVTVMLRGESGTGKEVIARALHAASARADKPIVKVDCAGMAETLIETELFGHERGAFTGANRLKKGKIELADGATLFLDEVGDLSPTAQTRLLRLLQDRIFERVGGTEPRTVDVRVIAATNQALEDMLEDGRFRRDLYYRLNVVSVELPPLRDRREDIELLARHFLSELAQAHKKKGIILHRSARSRLVAYQWPGNVRELRNLCENLVVTSRQEVITAALLPPVFSMADSPDCDDPLLDGSHSLAEIERHVIFQTLARTDGNKAEAARILGIGLKTLYRRLDDYGPLAEPSSG